MPVQNHGTLLENIVLLEAARLLCRRPASDPRPLDFANAFVLPPLSEWRDKERYKYQLGMRDARLERLLAAEMPEDGASYPTLLRRCLRADRSRGPNGALLVALVLRREKRVGRLWLNDLTEGEARYGGTASGLGQLGSTVDDLCGGPEEPPGLEVTLCTAAYPESLKDLAATLDMWRNTVDPAARLGFLDPDNYTTGTRVGPQTSSADHRRWLRSLLGGTSQVTLSVHFTGDSTTDHLHAAISSLHADGVACGYAATRAFQTYHYVVSVNCSDPSGSEQTTALAGELTARVREAWTTWFRVTRGPKERPRDLITIVDGRV